jgi:hypothetical protein
VSELTEWLQKLEERLYFAFNMHENGGERLDWDLDWLGREKPVAHTNKINTASTGDSLLIKTQEFRNRIKAP